ncbi:TonB-dependent receptor [Luteimonas gilva]|uniref:TonB-dependent receptor n=1 Tax=Luteimonas gilva TaxID=2572684 RepID=A0A4U5K4N8_9GAMM|nr:TonB-dependent receptor [Luteimonas gilva]TKR34039.1 TonB-dependent receptor [Luteimonas gilva]
MSQHHQRLFRRSALGLALGLCFSAGVQAQTNTAGAVAGRATAGDTITIENAATGFSRTITVGGDGSYRLSQIPIGQYTVTRKGADGATSTRTANVSVGTASSVDFVTAGGDAQTLDTVTVIGTGAVNPIDITSVESTTILTAQQIAKIPVARDATSVALLAPGTVRGDAAFGNLASFGGSSVAENQYYVNGFNITNSFQNLNFAQIPFEAVAEQQIKTGGYGAEFGRSLGGVINMITKRGTNDFHAGGNVFYEPESLNEKTKNVYQENGVLRQDNSKDSTWNAVASVWASGALVKDKLFAYGLVQYGRTSTDTWLSVVNSTNTSAVAKNPNWLLKMDWNISDNHLLELTAFSDKTKTDTDVFRNTVGKLDRTTFLGTNFTETGGENYVLKYTGYLTDTFTLSALLGHGEFSRSQHLRTANGVDVRYGGDLNNPASGCPIIIDARPAYRRALNGTRVSSCNITGGAIARQDSGDERDQYRIDAEWQLGDHLLRFGYDVDNFKSTAGTSIEGGRAWRYATNNGPDKLPNTGDEFDVVREQITNQGATVEVKQRAFYVQDSWNITDNFIAYIGGRWDSFENLNGQGATYVKIDNQFGPRLGFSWDVFGDSTFKVFGNAGRYALPLTATVAIRGASASLFSRENFNFTGFDPVTGAPTGLTSRNDFIFINGEFGSPKNAETIASKNLDPMYQDEYILGFQKTLSDHFTLGMRGIFRDLKAAIDDTCDYTAVLDAIAEKDPGLTPNLPNSGFPYCRLFNPGEDSVFVTDVEGDGTLRSYTIPGARLSPKAKRTYSAVEFFFDANWDKFFMQGSYTYAKSKGNTEGGVKSDIGQADTGTTQDFDYPELTVDSYGYLPNDRRHSLKLFGNYQITDEWSVGGNLLVQSGRPKNCLGVLEVAPGVFHPYGSSFFRCNGVPTPRGTEGRLPWTRNVDLNVAYKPAFAKGLQFKIDVFNVFNNQEVTAVNEQVEDPSTGARVEIANLPLSFQAPRSVRFMVQYDF